MYCEWCNDSIDESDSVIRIVEESDNRERDIAYFHTGVCFSEAANYGWRDE